jgi:hypothetical protein
VSFRKIAPLVKPAAKHDVHKKAAPVKPVAKKSKKKVHPRPVGR